MIKEKKLVWFDEVDKDNVALVGGKGANLGEMAQAGFPVPPGFIVTANAYYYFLEKNQLRSQIKDVLKIIDVQDPDQLLKAHKLIKEIILKAKFPLDLAKEIFRFYQKLSGPLKQALVAVRSSATAEDLPDASFAGQQETFLNIKGEANLIIKIRQCWVSLFTPRAIFYRQEKKFDHFKVGIAVPVQKMVQSHTSGVMFSLDPITNNKKVIVIEAVYGLGEMIVQGTVTPDHYEVSKQNFKIIRKQINRQEIQLIKVGALTKQTKVKPRLQQKQKISDDNIIKLAKLAKKLHQHYFFPQDIEWAIEKNKIYILQTRPITTLNKKSQKKPKQKIDLPLILQGSPASPGIASGYAKIIKSAKQINQVEKGDVLVTEMTTPDYVTAMKKVAAIITDKGGQTSHAAIVSRELGVPCVVGTNKATSVIKNGMMVTVNGKTGQVFQGKLHLDKVKITGLPTKGEVQSSFGSLAHKIKTATKVYVNLGEPELALPVSQRNVDGVGLLRAEFMISQTIGIHPKQLIKEKRQNFFIEKLALGIKEFCQAFAPRPVVYRATDFKTNEYKNLKGGQKYEPEEANPLLGYRGAFRYLNDEEVFELELEAIKKVRNKFGFKNIYLMVPFVRTVAGFQQVKKIISASGLIRSPSFKLWIMVEVPSTVILLEDFIKLGIDGVSIGTNDLTMLLLGIDRDNEKVSPIFNEQNKAVLWALERIIKTCQKNKITSSICGQAPSVYPQLTQKLVNWGITSVSVSPDAIEKTRKIIYQAEKNRVRK